MKSEGLRAKENFHSHDGMAKDDEINQLSGVVCSLDQL